MDTLMEQAERITKVKRKKNELEISWEQLNETTGTYDKYGITSKDIPLPELLKRLQVMSNHVEEICELPQGAAKKIVVAGIAISYSESNIHLVITAYRELSKSKSPMLINTPARPAYPEGDKDDTYCMSDECFRDLLAVANEAMKYIKGERAQQTLHFDADDEDQKKGQGGYAGEGEPLSLPMAAKGNLTGGEMW